MGGKEFGELSGNDNPGNDRVYNPEGFQLSLGGSTMNYSGSINLTYLGEEGVALNVTYSDEHVSPELISLGLVFSEINFSPKYPKTFNTLEGGGYSFTGSAGPLTIGEGEGYDSKGNVAFTTNSFGTPFTGKIGNKLNISASKDA